MYLSFMKHSNTTLISVKVFIGCFFRVGVRNTCVCHYWRGTANPPGTPDFTSILVWFVLLNLKLSVQCFVGLFFFCWPLYCLSFDLRLLITLWYLQTVLMFSEGLRIFLKVNYLSVYLLMSRFNCCKIFQNLRKKMLLLFIYCIVTTYLNILSMVRIFGGFLIFGSPYYFSLDNNNMLHCTYIYIYIYIYMYATPLSVDSYSPGYIPPSSQCFSIDIICMLSIPFYLFSLKEFKFIQLSNLLTLSVPIEDYSRNTLNLISTFLFQYNNRKQLNTIINKTKVLLSQVQPNLAILFRFFSIFCSQSL